MNRTIIRASALGSKQRSKKSILQTTRTTPREIIAASAWFGGAPDSVLDALAGAAKVREYQKDSHLWRAGESHAEVFTILSGRVRLYSTGFRGKEYALDDRGEGSWLGVSSLHDNQERDFSARTLVDSELLVLHRQAVLDAARDWPLLYRNLFSEVVENSRGLYALFAGVLFYPLHARVGLRLMQMVAGYGRQVEDGMLIDIKLSQNDLASLAGGSRQHINRILKEWEERGLVENRDERFLIRDMDAFSEELKPSDTQP